jgi:hypothetical protein
MDTGSKSLAAHFGSHVDGYTSSSCNSSSQGGNSIGGAGFFFRTRGSIANKVARD